MKLNKLFLAVATVGVLFSSCEQTYTPEPSPAAPANAIVAYFQTPDMTGVEVNPEDSISEYAIVVQRADSTGALTLGVVTLKNDNDVYNVPSSITFEAGALTDTLVVGINPMEAGVTYELQLQLDPQVVNPYAAGAENALCHLSITPIKWEPGVGVYYGGLISSTFGMPSTYWYVDYKIATMPDGSKKLCIVAPYTKLPAGAEVYTDEDGVDDAFIYYMDALEPNSHDFMLYISKDNVVSFNDLYLGHDWGYGEMIAIQYNGTGTYVEGVSVTFPDKVIAFAMGSDLYNYANFSLYLTKEAYLEATAVEAIDAEVTDYEGAFAMEAMNGMGETVTGDVQIASAENEDGHYYVINGISALGQILGHFNEKTHLMHIPAQYGAPYTDEETGVVYDVTLYTLDSEGYTSIDDLIMAYNEDGTITIDASSKAIGVIALAENPNDEEDYFFMDMGTVGITLTPAEVPAAIQPKLAAKKEALVKNSEIKKHLKKAVSVK